jgi:hypothetical protein
MLTVLIILVAILIGVGLTALYREVGLGRETSDAPSSAPKAKWPFGKLSVGGPVPGIADESFTGFMAMCTDEVDSLGELYAAAVVAEDWAYPLAIAVGHGMRSNGWTHRLDGLPGNVMHQQLSMDRIAELQPVQLPVLLFINEGKVLDASADLQSATAIANNFQRCRFGIARGAATRR